MIRFHLKRKHFKTLSRRLKTDPNENASVWAARTEAFVYLSHAAQVTITCTVFKRSMCVFKRKRTSVDGQNESVDGCVFGKMEPNENELVWSGPYFFFHWLQDVNSLEPTLQAALLPKESFDLLLEVSKEFEKGTLKDMKVPKPSRQKANPQLTQNQASEITSCIDRLNYEFVSELNILTTNGGPRNKNLHKVMTDF